MLKCIQPYFESILNGSKTFEVRPDDQARPYAVGDWLDLIEWDQTTGRTGRTVRVQVVYVMREDDRLPQRGGLKPNFCILGVSR